MEFLVTTTNAVTFNNKELQKATNTVFKLGDAIKRNWFAIAHIVAHVDATECYKDDGFNTVHEWVEKTFGIKKASAYQLANVGRRFFNSDSETAGKVVNLLNGKTGNLAELVNMTDEQLEDAIASEKLSADSTQKDLREIANSVKPAKVITEKKARLSAVISHMTENGKIEVVSSDSVIVDNTEILRTIGFSENDKLVKLSNLETLVHVEGKEDKSKVIGAEFLAYSVDGVYVARITCEYIEKPKAPKTPKAPTDYNMTEEERHLWYDFLRSYPVRFLRQKVIDQYIADFYCHAVRLVIELDGSQHYQEKGILNDKIRTEKIEQRGLTVLRIPNNEINHNFAGVCEYIDHWVKTALESPSQPEG